MRRRQPPRCPECGGMLTEGECQNQQAHPSYDAEIEQSREAARLANPPPPPGPPIGMIVSYEWPGGDVIPCMVTSLADEDGTIGLMILSANTRVPLEEIT